MSKFSSAINNYLSKKGYKTFDPKAVLFDMDGVLFDSMPNHAVAWQKSMAEYDVRMTADDAYATEGMRGVDTICSMVKAQKGIEISEEKAQEMYDEKARLFALMPKARLMPGIKELMSKIIDDGLKIVVVTGSGQRPLIERLKEEFSEFGVTEETIVCAYDVEKGKPNPDPYLMGLMKAGGLQPWEAIVVENAPMGVQAGVAAGILTIAVNSGPLDDKVLLDKGADILFPSILALFDNWDFVMRKDMKSEMEWIANWQAIIEHIRKYKRNPSKHIQEDWRMVNWLKYNRKVRNKGKLSAFRLHKLRQLHELSCKYRRFNKFTYANDLLDDEDII